MISIENKLAKSICVVSIFAIEMGFLESAVVVYLREIYYPQGFNFPLAPISQHIALTEILREAATIIMLLGIGYVSGRNFSTRFAWFIYSFAIWDIFYYVFLKLLLGWPESLLTDDILFLLPITWVGPVSAPIIISISMILLAMLIIVKDYTGNVTKLKKADWLLFIIGSFVLILGFTWDYSKFFLKHHSIWELFALPDNKALYKTASEYIPGNFNWLLFIVGQIIIGLGILRYWMRVRSISH
jgi:hypothetical protein